MNGKCLYIRLAKRYNTSCNYSSVWCLLLVQAYINHGKASAYALKERYDENIGQALPYSLHWRQDHEAGFHERHHNPVKEKMEDLKIAAAIAGGNRDNQTQVWDLTEEEVIS